MSKRLNFAVGPRIVTVSFIAVALTISVSCDDNDPDTNGSGGETGWTGGYTNTGGKSSSGGASAGGTKATGGTLSSGGSAAVGGASTSRASSVAGSSGLGGSSVAGSSGLGGSAGTRASGGSSTTTGSAVAGTSAFAGASGSAGAAGAGVTSFASLYTNVLSARCLPCHATGAGVSVGMLDLSTRAEAFTNLLGSNGTGAPAMGTSPGSAQATCASITNLLRVRPGDASTSLLWQKVNSKLAGTNPPCGNPMPPGTGAALTQQQVNEIAAWINRGAPND